MLAALLVVLHFVVASAHPPPSLPSLLPSPHLTNEMQEKSGEAVLAFGSSERKEGRLREQEGSVLIVGISYGAKNVLSYTIPII